MTRTRNSVPGRARLGCALCAVVMMATAAHSQQGWAPTISLGGEPVQKEQSRTPPKATAKKKIEPEFEPKGSEEQLVNAATQVQPKVAAPLLGTASIETGSTAKLQRPEAYCAAIVTPAADARFAWQKQVLVDLEQQIEKRIELLEERTAEYKTWLARRDEFSEKANETLLRIYMRMKPDAAAAQLSELDEETSAAVITKLEPRIASLILNEMSPAKAARLTAIISGAAKINPPAGAAVIKAKAQ